MACEFPLTSPCIFFTPKPMKPTSSPHPPRSKSQESPSAHPSAGMPLTTATLPTHLGSRPVAIPPQFPSGSLTHGPARIPPCPHLPPTPQLCSGVVGQTCYREGTRAFTLNVFQYFLNKTASCRLHRQYIPISTEACPQIENTYVH